MSARVPAAHAVLALALAGPALAQNKVDPAAPAAVSAAPEHAAPTPEMRAARQAMRQACAADLQSHCAGVQPGGGRVAQCLRTHAADLSDSCKTAIQSLRAARR